MYVEKLNHRGVNEELICKIISIMNKHLWYMMYYTHFIVLKLYEYDA